MESDFRREEDLLRQEDADIWYATHKGRHGLGLCLVPQPSLMTDDLLRLTPAKQASMCDERTTHKRRVDVQLFGAAAHHEPQSMQMLVTAAPTSTGTSASATTRKRRGRGGSS